MKPRAALATCRIRGISLTVEGDQLRFRAPAGTLDERLKNALKEGKEAIIPILETEGGPELVRAFSKVLNRTIAVSWFEDCPEIVYVDGTAYSTQEVEALSKCKAGEIRKVHEVKETFEGELQ